MTQPSPDADRLSREAMQDPESITVVVVGRNGHRSEIVIQGGERARLALSMKTERDDPYRDSAPLYYVTGPTPPAWQRFTFEIERRFSYRAEDFISTAATKGDPA